MLLMDALLRLNGCTPRIGSVASLLLLIWVALEKAGQNEVMGRRASMSRAWVGKGRDVKELTNFFPENIPGCIDLAGT
jgi:hypothetical protein